MKTDTPISEAGQRVKDALCDELHQSGEMLARLEEQQEHVLSCAAEEVLRSVAAMNSQMAVIQTARQKREAIQAELLQQLGEKTFEKLIPLLPEKYRLAVAPLVRENNELLVRVQQRARQNHLLLSRSLELVQQFIQTLIPSPPPITSFAKQLSIFIRVIISHV